MAAPLARVGGLVALLAGGCGGGGGGGGMPPDPDWEIISGDKIGVCVPGEPCTSDALSNNVAYDFAFDGDDILITTSKHGTLRLAPATTTFTEVAFLNLGINERLEVTAAGILAKGNAQAPVWLFDRAGNRLGGWEGVTLDTAFNVWLQGAPDGHVLASGAPRNGADPHGVIDIDPAVTGVATEVPLPDWQVAAPFPFAVDDAGRIYYQHVPTGSDTTLNILDRSTGQTTVVGYPTPPPDAEGNVFPAFIPSSIWGPVPGGGILAVKQTTRGADIVRVTADGQATFVVKADGAVGRLARLRVRDGYLYAGGFGILRSRQKLF